MSRVGFYDSLNSIRDMSGVCKDIHTAYSADMCHEFRPLP